MEEKHDELQDDVVEDQQEVDQTAQPLDEIAQLQAEVAQYKLGWQRAQADYQNLVKEQEANRSQFVQMCEQQIVEDFIPVYDNFKKAFAHRPEQEDAASKSWAEGIGFIKKQFSDILEQHHVKELKTIGETFDPAKHEAAGEQHSDEFDEGVIVAEVDAGYEMYDRVIKVAKVIVCKK